eukprot:1162062-Pelagomonas_calceolata.AAC.35
MHDATVLPQNAISCNHGAWWDNRDSVAAVIQTKKAGNDGGPCGAPSCKRDAAVLPQTTSSATITVLGVTTHCRKLTLSQSSHQALQMWLMTGLRTTLPQTNTIIVVTPSTADVADHRTQDSAAADHSLL